jgi:hypothetical protein
MEMVSFEAIAGRHVVVEEKVDGANCAISFGGDGVMRLQSRGHYLTGGPRERHFALFKQWAATHETALLEVLEDRYICYGEWLYAKHTVFYDALPHYFMEFDVLDTATGEFLSTGRRADLLQGLPIVSVRVMHEGSVDDIETLRGMAGQSAFRTARAMERLRTAAERLGLDAAELAAQTDPSPLMEGLYIKIEEEGAVQERYKFVRRDFVTRILDSESHWLMRPIVPNELRDGVDIFGGRP